MKNHPTFSRACSLPTLAGIVILALLLTSCQFPGFPSRAQETAPGAQPPMQPTAAPFSRPTTAPHQSTAMPTPIVVPDVSGMTVDEAANYLSRLGLDVQAPHSEYNTLFEAGRVVRSDPPPGLAVMPGAEVVLVVSQGPEAPLVALEGRITLVTGDDSTRDNPVLELHGDFPGAPYQVVLDQPNDLGPGQSNTYDFMVPAEFCAITGFSVSKPAGPGGDDSWYLRQIFLSLDGVEVFFDGVADRGMTSTSYPCSGGWTGTEDYRTRCGG